MVVIVVKFLARGDLVIDRVEADGDRDDHSGHRQSVEESRQNRRHK